MPPFHDEPIEAIIVMHDPTDWAPEIQIATDVLIGGEYNRSPALHLQASTIVPLV